MQPRAMKPSLERDVAIVGDDNEFVEIELPDGTIERQLGPNSGVRTLDTADTRKETTSM